MSKGVPRKEPKKTKPTQNNPKHTLHILNMPLEIKQPARLWQSGPFKNRVAGEAWDVKRSDVAGASNIRSPWQVSTPKTTSDILIVIHQDGMSGRLTYQQPTMAPGTISEAMQVKCKCMQWCLFKEMGCKWLCRHLPTLSLKAHNWYWIT